MAFFDIFAVHQKFSACLCGDDVLLREYCDAYAEVSKLLSYLGAVFYFVTRDVDAKLRILYQLNSQKLQAYRSIRSMCDHEAGAGLSDIMKNSHSGGCRTLLRLHRALLFVINLMEALITAPLDASLRTLTKDTYDADLGPYHTWTVRKAVSLAVYALPSREQLVDKIVDSQPPEYAVSTRGSCANVMLNHTLPSMRTVYECCDKWLAHYDMLQLP